MRENLNSISTDTFIANYTAMDKTVPATTVYILNVGSFVSAVHGSYLVILVQTHNLVWLFIPQALNMAAC